METNKRCYERLDGRAFIAEVQALIVSSGTPGKAAKAVKPVKVAAAVKKALPSRK
jgi:hypothetical protein